MAVGEAFGEAIGESVGEAVSLAVGEAVGEAVAQIEKPQCIGSFLLSFCDGLIIPHFPFQDPPLAHPVPTPFPLMTHAEQAGSVGGGVGVPGGGVEQSSFGTLHDKTSI